MREILAQEEEAEWGREAAIPACGTRVVTIQGKSAGGVRGQSQEPQHRGVSGDKRVCKSWSGQARAVSIHDKDMGLCASTSTHLAVATSKILKYFTGECNPQNFLECKECLHSPLLC